MALIDAYNLANDPIFRARVTAAIVTSAQNIKSEAPATPNHALRTAFCDVVLSNPPAAAAAMAYDIAIQAGGTIAAPPTDAAIQVASDATWNANSKVP